MIVQKPDLSIETLLPEIIVTVLALVLLMVDLFLRGRNKQVLTGISVVGYVAALAVCVYYFFTISNTPTYAFGNPAGQPQNFTGAMLVQDHLGLFFRMLAVLTALLGTLFAANFIEERGMALGEFYTVLALGTLGGMVVGASNDLIMIFVGIELLSISTYIMTGFARTDRRSNEASIKYFLLGTFATAILVYGMAWLFGMTGSTNLVQIAGRVGQIGAANNGYLLLAILLIVAGLGFKIAAVPFHMWTPDAYQGAPTPVTAIMSVGPKAAGFAAIVRILIEALGPAYAQWQPIIIIMSILTMTLGNVVGLSQGSVKRMLAYSSIAHTGYLLVGIAAFRPAQALAGQNNDAVASVLFYLFSYVIMNIGAFGVVVWLQHNRGAEFLDDFRGLSQWAPGPAFIMMVLLLSLTGIPPTIGFLAKYYLFVAALRADLGWLAVIGMLNSAVAAFYYLRVIWYMYFEQPRGARAAVPSNLLVGSLALTAALVVIFFIAAGPVLDMARQSLPLVLGVAAGR